jgi:hypothetical protein
MPLTWPDDDYWSSLVFASGSGGYTALQTSEALMPGDPPAPTVRPGSPPTGAGPLARNHGFLHPRVVMERAGLEKGARVAEAWGALGASALVRSGR